MKLRWTTDAADDLEAIHDWLLLNRPAFANNTVNAIHAELKTLRQFPWLGRPTERPQIRAFLFKKLPYICIYRVSETAVHLLHIYHVAENRPPDLQ